MTYDSESRELLGRVLSWQDAHVGFEEAVADLPPGLRGGQPAGLPHSPWQLLEHLRIAQHDILDFCRNPHYTDPKWPDDYWPPSPAPPSAEAWDASVRQFLDDREALRRLAEDPGIDLGARIPHGTGQTYVRELLLAADHAAYHIGQLVLVRQSLGAWPAR
jgi:hypothetical protein